MNAQAIVGQALTDLILASTETKVRTATLARSSTGNSAATHNYNITEVLSSITEGNELYEIHDFYVSVFSLDQTLCYSAEEQEQGLMSRDNSGCCIAHGGNPDYVGSTWQDILDQERITSIRGTDLHNRLIGQTDRGGIWTEYSWAQSSGGAQVKRAFSSRFRDAGDSYYVVVEHFKDLPPPTCDSCPGDMACTKTGQFFCEPKSSEVPFRRSSIFVILMVVIFGIPILGVFFCWIGKKREELQARAQLQEIDQKMQTMSKQIETQKKTASRAQKLVSSLFPKNVHDRIMEQIEDASGRDLEEDPTFGPSTKDKLHHFLSGDDPKTKMTKSKPIADLFPEATISFAGKCIVTWCRCSRLQLFNNIFLFLCISSNRYCWFYSVEFHS